jgi:hypothetical protein
VKIEVREIKEVKGSLKVMGIASSCVLAMTVIMNKAVIHYDS